MKIYIYTAWVNCPSSKRLEEAQNTFLKSCLNFDYTPVFYTDIHIPEQRPKMNDLITYAIANCREKDVDWLVWVNSDCEIVIGATHIDWWLARYFQKRNELKMVFDYLHHNSHEKSKEANHLSGDKISQHNVDNFTAWAKRNDIDYSD
jgi:hypothetical protein|tara:strand:- start:273 stop:716 length:444 start_codon:yes stop_codon:yes gene_type:complete